MKRDNEQLTCLGSWFGLRDILTLPLSALLWPRGLKHLPVADRMRLFHSDTFRKSQVQGLSKGHGHQ